MSEQQTLSEIVAEPEINGSECGSTYRIGDVARLTGIRADTIRAWERRYQVVAPFRASNQNRYYTHAQFRRLLMMKGLVDAGYAISSVSQLPDDQLAVRVKSLRGDALDVRTAGWNIVSRQQPAWLRKCIAEHFCCDVIWHTQVSSLTTFDRRLMLIDMPSLSEDHEQEIVSHIPSDFASRCLVVYHFSSRTQLRVLSQKGYKLLKGPLAPCALANHLL